MRARFWKAGMRHEVEVSTTAFRRFPWSTVLDKTRVVDLAWARRLGALAAEGIKEADLLVGSSRDARRSITRWNANLGTCRPAVPPQQPWAACR
jgi:hypothetical protein